MNYLYNKRRIYEKISKSQKDSSKKENMEESKAANSRAGYLHNIKRVRLSALYTGNK